VPAVWHKEILWAMSQGIHVYGSASMGALRAAELAKFGMRGVGQIFEAYQNDTLEDDDEVAVAHGYAEAGFVPLSEAMVNIRSTLTSAEAAGVVSPSTRTALEQVAKELFYPERSFPRVLQEATARGLPAAELAKLRKWLPHGCINQKREDALAMLRVMRQELADSTEPKRVQFALEHTVAWDRLTSLAGSADHLDSEGTVEMITTSALLDELRLEPDTYTRAFQEALLRHLALGEASRRRDAEDAEAVKKSTAAWCRTRGLDGEEALDRWLAEHHLARAQFDELMREEALLAQVPSRLQWEVMRRLADHLRVTGEYTRLIQRARGKQTMLEARGLKNLGLADAGVSAEELRQWYFERLGVPVPASMARYARSAGFPDEDAFMRAVLREYCFVRVAGGG
jgi:hypothetical protein